MQDNTIAKKRGERLTLLRKMAGLTLTELSEKYNIGYSTLTQWENGRISGLSTKGAEKIISIMQQEGVLASTGWLLHGEGAPPQIARFVAATTKTPSLSDEITTFEQYSANHITLTIDDDAMMPVFHQGDIVGGEFTNKSHYLGKDCIVELANHQWIARKVLAAEPGVHLFGYNSNSTNPTLILSNHHILRAAPITRLWREHQNSY